MVGPPVDDALLDGFGFEVLGEGAMHQGGEFGVGGEAEGDELAGGELVDVGKLVGRDQGGYAEPFFEADDPVLRSDCILAAEKSQKDERQRHDDPPKIKVAMCWPVMDGGVNREHEIEDKERHQDEMEGRIAANMIAGALRFGHLCSLSVRRLSCSWIIFSCFLGVPPPGGYLCVTSF